MTHAHPESPPPTQTPGARPHTTPREQACHGDVLVDEFARHVQRGPGAFALVGIPLDRAESVEKALACQRPVCGIDAEDSFRVNMFEAIRDGSRPRWPGGPPLSKHGGPGRAVWLRRTHRGTQPREAFPRGQAPGGLLGDAP